MKGRPATLLAIALGAVIAACSSDSLTSPSENSAQANPDSVSTAVPTSTTDSSTIITEADTTLDAGSTSAAGDAAGPLVSCPATSSNTVSSKYIGPDGGTVKLAPFTLKIPAGSLSTPALVTLRRPPGDQLAIEATVGDSPHHQFAAPVEFVVRVSKYCPSVTPEMVASLKGVWLDGPNGQQSLKSWRDTASGKVRFLTDHFSSYGIAW
ncbi:MAG TPA: hypothetical protein VJ672_17810 [Gemmatimonadaceae bacterium]|nr:hypothetical protein [Gemmatimonadaceae bacterium]